MSDKAIELFIRMHLERTPTLQRGRQVLTGDVILAVMGTIQRENKLGCDLISARWLNDLQATKRVEERIREWANESSRPDLMYYVGILGLSIFCGRPTADQEKKLVSLWTRFSAMGKRSQRLISRHQAQIKFLKGIVPDTDFREKQIHGEIYKLNTLIDNERIRLHSWASKQAKAGYQCPKCGGTGNNATGNQCNECHGMGNFTPKAANVREHLKKTGAQQVSDKLWAAEVKPKFEELMGMFQREHDETARLLGKRLAEERAA